MSTQNGTALVNRIPADAPATDAPVTDAPVAPVDELSTMDSDELYGAAGGRFKCGVKREDGSKLNHVLTSAPPAFTDEALIAYAERHSLKGTRSRKGGTRGQVKCSQPIDLTTSPQLAKRHMEVMCEEGVA